MDDGGDGCAVWMLVLMMADAAILLLPVLHACGMRHARGCIMQN